MKWFVGAGLILLFALVFQLELLAYAMYALLAVMVVSRLLAQTWITNLHATRTCDQSVAEIGDTITVSLKIKNHGLLPVAWVLLEDLLPKRALLFNPPSLAVSGQRLRLTMLGGGATRLLRYELTCNRRGYYQVGPLVLETGDLFGLHRRWRVATEPQFLLVYPKVIPMEGFNIASKRPIGEVRMTYRLFEDPTRIAGVREYQQGDPLNRVNWNATARTGTLHSKIYEPSTVAGVTLLMEFHRQAHHRAHEPVRSELAVTAAASIANAMYEMNQQIGLVTNGRDAADRIRQEGHDAEIRSRKSAHTTSGMLEASDRLQPVVVRSQRGPEQLTRILETLARLELTDGLNLGQLISETASRLPRNATVVAILPKVTMGTAITLGSLKKRGFAVTAILNVYETQEFADASGPLIAEGIETLHLRDESSIVHLCRKMVLR